MNRKSGILAAGTLTGLVLIIILIFGMSGLNAAENNSTTLPSAADAIVVDQPTANTTNSETLQAWQTYSSELENTVETLQKREGQYQAELNAANDHELGEHDQHEAYEHDD